MATALTHFVVGACVALPFALSRSLGGVLRPRDFVIASGAIALLPDADVLLMRWVPYASFYGHRGFFHSPFFLVVLCAAFAGLARIAVKDVSSRGAALLMAVWTAAAISHPILDALTDGGLGVMLLFPFRSERYFFGWRPIHVAPIGFRRAAWGLVRAFPSEWPFCVGALVFAAGGYWIASKRTASQQGALKSTNAAA
ncbi:MAG TPA: metal-dependent hydrolase [Candidatus Solibacter sp.]|nr:metal-dependent hydrolase [Candidatus Solibacter sp.]